jgi:NADPH2:quinone reductase
VVRTSAADVLFLDALIRSGRGVDFFPLRPPYVPGNGVAGQVISGGDGAGSAWAGRAVVAHTGGPGGSGGYAEQAVVAVGDLIAVPPGLRPTEAAALLHDGSTAVGLLDRAGVRPGEWVLITAAGGGMGVLLLIRRAGAEAAVDCSEPGWTGLVRELTAGRGAGVVLDGAGGPLGRAAFEVTAPGGRFSAHGISGGGFAAITPQEAGRRGITVHGIGQYDPATFRAQAAAALVEAAAGRLEPVIGQTFPLGRAADAHAAIEARATVAKTLLLTDVITA